MTDIIYILLISIISINFIKSNPCNIIENMSCKCHTSYNSEYEQLICNNYNKPIDSTVKLTNETMQKHRSFSSFHLTFYDENITIYPMFINELSYLFPRLTQNAKQKNLHIKILLSFPNFAQLNFNDYSFYLLFNEKSFYTTILTLELTSNGKIIFSPFAFSQLTVDQLYLHSSSLEPYSFEEIFNNTNIGELTIEGLTPRSDDTHRQYFNGKIRLAKFTKMIETVSSDEFPNYPVRSMIIEAHEARRINASTFINYRNLHGFHFIRPKFFFDNRSFDGLQYLTNLETIELDAETLKDYTFQHVSRIRFLTLGQNLRYLTEHSFDYLNYLTRFDVSKLVLDQLYPSSRCILARFIEKQLKSNPTIIILPPQAEYCDCIYDFILTILNKKPNQSYKDLCSNNQQERCQLNECNIVKNFHIPINENLNQQLPVTSIDGSVMNTPILLNSINNEITTTHKLPSYVHRHPSVAHRSKFDNKSHINIQDSKTSALIANKPIDSNAIPTDDYFEDLNPTSTKGNSQRMKNKNHEQQQIAMKNETLKWLSLSLVCITILCILLVGTLIWFFTCRPSKRHNKAGFKPVEPNSSNV